MKRFGNKKPGAPGAGQGQSEQKGGDSEKVSRKNEGEFRAQIMGGDLRSFRVAKKDEGEMGLHPIIEILPDLW